MKRILVFIIVLVVSFSFLFADDSHYSNTVSGNENTAVHVYGGNEAELRDYIAHMAGTSRFFSESVPSVYIRQLPPALSVDFPLSDSFHIVGSVVRENGENIEVVMESDWEIQSIVDFFDVSLRNSGWRAGRELPRIGGFHRQPVHFIYCNGDRFSLSVTLFEYKDEAANEIRMQIQAGQNILCGESDGGTSVGPEGNDPFFNIPYLSPPGNVRVSAGGGGSSGGPFGPHSAFQSAILKTDYDLTFISRHYADQLKNGYNWRIIDNLVTDKFSYSTWKFINASGVPLNGMLVITGVPERTGEYMAMVQVFSD